MNGKRPTVLLVNPPIYDFAAYDFWLKPYGLLRAAGTFRGRADMRLFDYLDRTDPAAGELGSDAWGRGKFSARRIATPEPLRGVRRRFRRYGLPCETFVDFLATTEPFDAAMIQTSMTYWYPGVREVIEDIRNRSRQTKIILGGAYASLCGDHARGLGADCVVEGGDLTPAAACLGVASDPTQPALWEAYRSPTVGAIKLTDGCPFRCTYCAVDRLYDGFTVRPVELVLAELESLIARGATDIAFYDDALLHHADAALLPLLNGAAERGLLGRVRFHTPNGLNARFLTTEAAAAMIAGGFKTFYLGFESRDERWQRRTGGKVDTDELAAAVARLLAAGADRREITAYLILGHPATDDQHVADSMRHAHSLGIRLMLADFSPIPGTPDGDACRDIADLDEPLWHNKTAFTLKCLGEDRVNELKALGKTLNGALDPLTG